MVSVNCRKIRQFKRFSLWFSSVFFRFCFAKTFGIQIIALYESKRLVV